MIAGRSLLYTNNLPEFAGQNVLEIVFNGFKGRKLVLRNCIFSNINSQNLDSMVGKKW